MISAWRRRTHRPACHARRAACGLSFLILGIGTGPAEGQAPSAGAAGARVFLVHLNSTLQASSGSRSVSVDVRGDSLRVSRQPLPGDSTPRVAAARARDIGAVHQLRSAGRVLLQCAGDRACWRVGSDSAASLHKVLFLELGPRGEGGEEVVAAFESVLTALAPIYAVQVFAATDDARAGAIQRQLQSAGFSSSVWHDRDGLHKVRVGRFTSRSEARRAAQRLSRELGHQAFVVELLRSRARAS